MLKLEKNVAFCSQKYLRMTDQIEDLCKAIFIFKNLNKGILYNLKCMKFK